MLLNFRVNVMVSRFNLSCSGPCFPPVPPSSLCPVSLLLSSAHAFLSTGEPLTGMCADIGGKYRRQCWEASPLPPGAHSPFRRMDICGCELKLPAVTGTWRKSIHIKLCRASRKAFLVFSAEFFPRPLQWELFLLSWS